VRTAAWVGANLAAKGFIVADCRNTVDVLYVLRSVGFVLMAVSPVTLQPRVRMDESSSILAEEHCETSQDSITVPW